jgi:hypothetical protein
MEIPEQFFVFYIVFKSNTGENSKFVSLKNRVVIIKNESLGVIFYSKTFY